VSFTVLLSDAHDLRVDACRLLHDEAERLLEVLFLHCHLPDIAHFGSGGFGSVVAGGRSSQAETHAVQHDLGPMAARERDDRPACCVPVGIR
jgi:hypothetical protein